MKLIPYVVKPKVGFEQAWDDAYDALWCREYEAWNRFPEVLCPEWEHLWYWQRVHPFVYQLQRHIWTSRLIQRMWNGYGAYERYRSTKPEWFQRLAHWLCGGRRAPIKKWWLYWLRLPTGGSCPRCGLESDDVQSDWFQFTGGGSAFTGDYTQHWFEGVWTCRRCLFQWDFSDSD